MENDKIDLRFLRGNDLKPRFSPLVFLNHFNEPRLIINQSTEIQVKQVFNKK